LKILFDPKSNNRIVQKPKYPNPIRTTIAKKRERIDLFTPSFEPYSLYFGYLNTRILISGKNKSCFLSVKIENGISR
jgi:hypothetical protein